jgi:16S rRNA (guanine(1405)-N(7))-methyltransferase
MNLTDPEIQQLIENTQSSRKYRGLGLNPDTIRDLIIQEAPHHTSQKKLRKSVRRKLHNIVAPYLGEPDYSSQTAELMAIKSSYSNSQEIQEFCLKSLSDHTSTAERIPFMEAFYQRIFAVTGKPEILLDLACGLHPLAFPWMGLPTSTQYHAFDIIQPRIDFINIFFIKSGLPPLAKNQDILAHPPQTRADLCLFFKEAHRFEKRSPGCNQKFWASLNTQWLAISLPTQNLAGTHSLVEQHRALIKDNLPQSHGRLQELSFENEIVFLVEMPGGNKHA